MKAQTIDDVEKFAREHKKLICYGASDHGHMVKHYLEMKGFSVDGFWITDPVEKGLIRDGVPLHSIDDIEEVTSDCGVLLSLYERHQEGVTMALIKKGFDEPSICAIPDLMQHEMHRKVLVKRRIDILSKHITISDEQKNSFAKSANEIFSKYSKIRCRFFPVWRLGCYGLWIAEVYFRVKCHDDKKFWLYYPVAHEHRPDQEMRGANSYLLTLLKTEGAEVISENNLLFWQFMFRYYKDKFEFDNRYEYMTWSGEIFDHYNEISINKSLLHLDDKDRLAGERELIRRAVRRPFVCLSNRDPAFLNKEKGDIVKEDFRDIYRNSNFESRALAIDYLKEHNIQAVRVGSVVQKKWEYDNLIDCTGKNRTDFFDVYLNMESKFFVSDLSGVMTFALLCAKPLVIINSTAVSYRYDGMVFYRSDRDIAIYKKLWDKRHNRFLTIRQMLECEVNIATQEKNSTAASLRYYYDNDIVPISNSAEEIKDAVKEMNERIDGTIQYDQLDLELQERYRELVDNFPLEESVLSNWRMGAKFLRDNQWLIN